MIVTASFPAGRVYSREEQDSIRRWTAPEPDFYTEDPPPSQTWEKPGAIRNSWGDFSVNLARLLVEIPDLHLTVKGVPEALKLISERVIPPVKDAVEHNETVNVVVPDIGVLAIRHVRLLENGCTDELQRLLDNGWRLLAVCPQPARRPDYILGTADFSITQIP